MGVVLIAGGSGVGIATGVAMSRTTSVSMISWMSSLAFRAGHFATVPGSLLTVVTGTWFIVDDSGMPFQQFDITEPWLVASYVAWVLAVGIGGGVLERFNHRLHQQAKDLEAKGIHDSEELRMAASSPARSVAGMAQTALLVLFLFLMVYQPGA